MMTDAERIRALQGLGYDEREAGFLAVAALHGGYFLRRQFESFAQLKRGRVSGEFLRKTVEAGHARLNVYANRAEAYHLFARPFYSAIAEEENRNRRSRPPLSIKAKLIPREEQRRIEFVASSYLRHVIIIMTEMGLRPYKELLPTRREHVDLGNQLVYIPDSKTESGVAEMPMTRRAAEAYRERLAEIPSECPWLFPSPVVGARKPYIQSLKRAWSRTLQKAGVRYFPLYHLRHTFASRLSAGGVSDPFVTLLLRQGDATVFKRYSHADLRMKRDALAKLEAQEPDSRLEDSGTSVLN